MDKYRVSQTLISAWQYAYKLDDGYESFLKTLNRQKDPPTTAMLDGVRFENLVNAALDGNPVPDDHEWARPVLNLSRYLDGAQKQVSIYKDLEVEGEHILLHGILDFLKRGVIYDTKFSKTYKVGKFLSSPQHPAYLELVPEAYRFEYLICDGTYIYREKYDRYETPSILPRIRDFLRFLKQYNLWDTYTEKWRAY
jgi:hypothetical protein